MNDEDDAEIHRKCLFVSCLCTYVYKWKKAMISFSLEGKKFENKCILLMFYC
jgi:hypothetical protein